MHVFYADQFVLPLPEGHRFPMHKYALLREALQQNLPQLHWVAAQGATEGELALVHTPAYVQAVCHGHLSASMQRDIGFPWSVALVERARRSVGATVQAARTALSGQGVAANLAGGTHHALADRGGGFCVFNDVAVAARLMQAEWARLPPYAGRAPSVLQVAIVDLDVHQGNGTARIFQGDESVFTLSLHGAHNYPVRKEVGDYDVELPDGCEDGPYLEALELALAVLQRRFQPDLLLYVAGADPHQDDRLGRLHISDAGMRARDQMVFDWAYRCGVPVAMTMAGGYGDPIESTVRVQVRTFKEALAYWQRWQNRPHNVI